MSWARRGIGVRFSRREVMLGDGCRLRVPGLCCRSWARKMRSVTSTRANISGSSQTGVTLPSRSSGSPSEWRRRRPGGIAGTGACRQEPFGLHSPGRPGLPPCHQSKRVTPKCEEPYFNHGPWRIPYHHRSTLHYTREFGIPLEIFVNHNEAAFVYREAAGPLSGKAVRQKEIIADMRGHAAEILAKHVDQDALELPLTQEEREKFLEFLVGEGQLERSSLDYLGTGGRGYLREPGAGLNPGEASLPHGLSALLQSDLHGIVSSVSGFTQQKTMFQPIGGMDRIPKAFEKVLGEVITYGAQVTRLQQNEERVLVDYRSRTTGESHQVEADYCLCTIPLSVLRGIENDFTPEFKGAMEAVSYTPTCKLALQMRSRFWEVEDHVFGGHSFTHNSETGNISYPSTGWQGQKGILQGVYKIGRASCRERVEMSV